MQRQQFVLAPVEDFMAAHRYTLRRINWRKTDRDVGGGPAPEGIYGWLRLPGSVRVATFADADAAESERRRLEGEAQAVINPFRCGSSLTEQTSLDEGRLCDWLLDHGLTPPAAEGRDWVRWYEGLAVLDDYQRARIWEALDRVRFYEVVEGPVCPLVFVAVKIPWDWVGDGRTSPEHFATNDEGGDVEQVFRTRGEADRFCKRNWSGGLYGDEPWEMTDRQRLRDDPLGLRKGEEVRSEGLLPEYDVAEVEVLDLVTRGKVVPAAAFGAKLFLVCRPAWWLEIDGRLPGLHWLDDYRVPVAAFTDRDRAGAHAAELTRQAWAELSPSVLFHHVLGALANFSTRGEGRWLRRLAALSIELPGKKKARPGRPPEFDWKGWANAVAPRLSVEQRAAIWALCDRLRLYDVAEVTSPGNRA
jgi:hypothetical protein